MNGRMTVPIAARLVDTAGRYRIELTSDGETVAEAEFDVEES